MDSYLLFFSFFLQNIGDLGGNTPLHLACAAGHLETVKTLLEFAWYVFY